MNKRDLMLSLVDTAKKPDRVPAAFFLHFDPVYHTGKPAVEKHLEYFRYTGMDFVKIQYERGFPSIPEIQKPEDWAKMPSYPLDFYEEQLGVVKGLVEAAKKEALVILTLYSPFMCAGHSTSDALLTRHIQENPQKVNLGMEAITASLMRFVKECVRLGIDGFYTSTQGGEAGRLQDPALFDQCIRPFDLALMEEINRSCIFNILHICDYVKPYSDLTRFKDYPGHVVNCSFELTTGTISAKEAARIFNRPMMGGLNRKGILATGSQQDVRREAEKALAAAPDRFILAADCTVPSETPWDNLRAAISSAHGYRKAD